MSELKPCPFCGHKPLSYVQTGVVACCYSMCGVNPSCDNAGAWNSRDDTEELERLRSERDELVKFAESLQLAVSNEMKLEELLTKIQGGTK